LLREYRIDDLHDELLAWLVAQVRSKSRLSAAFWVVMFFPMVFIALLPETFFV
jgi:hypothetical protein